MPCHNSFRAHPPDPVPCPAGLAASGEPDAPAGYPVCFHAGGAAGRRAGTADCHIIALPLPRPRALLLPSAACSSSAPSGSPGPRARAVAPVSDPRVNTARVLVERNRFAEALEILRPLAPDHPDQTDVRFLLGLAASRGSQEPGRRGRETARAPGRGHRGVPVHPDPRPGLVRVRLELALAFYLKEEDAVGPRPFRAGPGGPPPAALVANINRFLNIMRARRRWRGYFGFSIAPDTNINAASDAEFIYINGLPFRRGQHGPGQFRYRRGGLGRRRIPVSPGRRWRLRTGIDLNHREYKGSRFDQTFAGGLRGAALADQPEYRDEPAGHREPALVGRLQLEL